MNNRNEPTIKVNFPKPALKNNGTNVFIGHPDIELTEEQSGQLFRPGDYGDAYIEYSDGKTAYMFVGRNYKRPGWFTVS